MNDVAGDDQPTETLRWEMSSCIALDGQSANYDMLCSFFYNINAFRPLRVPILNGQPNQLSPLRNSYSN